MRFLILLISISSLLALSSCTYKDVELLGRPDTPYHDLQAKMSKSGKVYGLENVLFDTDVTYFSKELRELYVEEYAKTYDLNEIEKEELYTKMMEEVAEYDDFYILHFASQQGYQTLTERSPHRKVWVFRLEDQGANLRPEQIQALTLNDQRRYFYPGADGFQRLYRVRFRKTTLPTKNFTMQSPARTLEFSWEPSS